MTAWAHLPNAALIDEVLASIKTSPEKWGAARAAVWDVARDAPQDAAWTAVWGAAWDAVWDTVRAAARDVAWLTARDATWLTARDATWGVAGGAARNTAAAWSAVAALVAYDEAGQFMKLPVDHLLRLHRLDPHPMFLLLQPAAIVLAEQGDPICPG